MTLQSGSASSQHQVSVSRRNFLQAAGVCVAAGTFGAHSALSFGAVARQDETPLYEISLAEWSLHRALQSGRREHLDFARDAKEEFGISAVEYVNQFFKEKANDTAYLDQMKTRAADHGVKSLLIMVDGEGQLGAVDEAARQKTVDNHKRWVEAAKHLGCHSIRVNAASSGSKAEQQKLAADGLLRLSEFAADHEMNVLVENHGGLSSNGAWLAGVMEIVSMDNCGTLPDFGNFRIGRGEEYDRYEGVADLIPYAKAVSAKSHDFDEEGNEKHTDYDKMMRIVLKAGYRGFVGIEYEGSALPEPEGILATKKLLERTRENLKADFS